ncbi:MAG: insulinase family protein [Myxococcaceae bacterium]|nr:insulinase family protein [Myxococcaceae bacterium]
MRGLLAALLLAPALPALAQAPKGEAPAIPFERYKLDNGLEVILSQDRRLPVVAVNLWYHVGALHEQPGRTGFAHLFEHMMFQGSKNVGDDVHISRLEQLGASELNGTTNFDRTNYFETVPSNHLATALWLESDRMGFLLDALTEEKLGNQREVVKNERRQSTETAPYGLAEEEFWQALFPSPHPYSGVVIGSMKDLEAASLEDVRAFFRKWYAPSNATLAVVGDFDEAEARRLIEKYFGSLPSPPRPKPPHVGPVTLKEPVVLRHAEQVATLPKVFVGWLTPAIYQEGDATADVLAAVLGSGKSSRLYERLVFDKQLAQSVSATQQSLGAQSVFTIEATARPGVTTDQLLAEIDAVLEDVRKNGVTAEEVQRVRNKLETGRIRGLQKVGGFGGKADQLQTYNHYLGDPGRLDWDLARYDAVTPQSVQAFAREALASNRVVMHAVPPPKGPAAPQSRTAPAPAPAPAKEGH